MADSDSQSTGRIVGAIQMVGGALEIALGAGGVAAPTGVTQVGGVILIAHGADTFLAGFRSMYYGEVSTTYTQQGATWAAKQAHASDQTAHYIGVGTDIVAGVGPSIGIGISRRLAIAGATRAGESVSVAYLSRSAFEMGHNAVGIRQGGTTAWVHFAGRPIGQVVARGAPAGEYVITELAVSSEQAAAASATRQILVGSAEQAWGYLGPNCTTTTLEILRSAGIVVPAWSRTPMLLQLGLKAGAEITIFGGTAAAIGGALGGAPAPQRARNHRDGHLLIHGHHHRHVAVPIVLPPKG
jgi:hypothetical protein